MFLFFQRSQKKERYDIVCRLIVKLGVFFQNLPCLSPNIKENEPTESFQKFPLLARLFGTSPCKSFLVLPL